MNTTFERFMSLWPNVDLHCTSSILVESDAGIALELEYTCVTATPAKTETTHIVVRFVAGENHLVCDRVQYPEGDHSVRHTENLFGKLKLILGDIRAMTCPITPGVYVVKESFARPRQNGMATYKPGMKIELVELTDERPQGLRGLYGNWYVRCPFFSPPQPESVWSSIHRDLFMGLIEKVK